MKTQKERSVLMPRNATREPSRPATREELRAAPPFRSTFDNRQALAMLKQP